jgi:hypothetical protein
LRELITGLRVWYVGCGKDNPLYLAVLDRMRGLGVLEVRHLDAGAFIRGEFLIKPQDTPLIVFDTKWVRDHVGGKDFHRLLQHSAAHRIPIAAVGGETSKLMVALDKAGVDELAVDEFGNVRNPLHHNPDLGGFRKEVETLPDGRLNWFPSILSANGPAEELVRVLIDWGK